MNRSAWDKAHSHMKTIDWYRARRVLWQKLWETAGTREYGQAGWLQHRAAKSHRPLHITTLVTSLNKE